jgi:cytochrome o ubiquinol oxidase subunit 1
VAHFHNMLIPGLLFGMLAGYHYWVPKAFGFRLDERWGRIAFGLWVAGFVLAFMPLYALGLLGMPRRTVAFFDPAYLPYTIVAVFGAALILAALASLLVQLWVSIRRREDTRVFAGDPWNGRTLEWGTSAPPPEYNFAILPVIEERDPFFAAKCRGDAYVPPETYDDIEMPRNSATGAAIGVAGTAAGFGLVWHIWWLAIAGLVAVWAAIIARSFMRNTIRIIPAGEVRQTEERWLRAVAQATGVTRDEEVTEANRGLAEVRAA